MSPEPENAPVADPPAPAPLPAPADPSPVIPKQKCPECGAQFSGVSVSHASAILAGLREDLAALKKELTAEKAKQAIPPAADPPAPAAAPTAKKRSGMLYGK